MRSVENIIRTSLTDQQIVSISERLNLLPSLHQKLKLIYTEAGVHYLFCDKHQATKDGTTYTLKLGFDSDWIEDKDLPNVLVRTAFLRDNYVPEVLEIKKHDIEHRNENRDCAEVRDILEEERRLLISTWNKKSGLNNHLEELYLLGYSNQKRKFTDIPKIENEYRCWYIETDAISYFDGAVDCLLTQYLDERITSLENELNNKIEINQLPDNHFALKGYNEKLLFIKHSGIFNSLKQLYKKKNGDPHYAKIASIIGYIINEKSVSTIEGKLGFLEHPEKAGTNNPYTQNSVPNTIKALEDAGITDEWLLQFSKRYYKEAKD